MTDKAYVVDMFDPDEVRVFTTGQPLEVVVRYLRLVRPAARVVAVVGLESAPDWTWVCETRLRAGPLEAYCTVEPEELGRLIRDYLPSDFLAEVAGAQYRLRRDAGVRARWAGVREKFQAMAGRSGVGHGR